MEPKGAQIWGSSVLVQSSRGKRFLLNRLERGQLVTWSSLAKRQPVLGPRAGKSALQSYREEDAEDPSDVL